jgi:hypothetical protein
MSDITYLSQTIACQFCDDDATHTLHVSQFIETDKGTSTVTDRIPVCHHCGLRGTDVVKNVMPSAEHHLAKVS